MNLKSKVIIALVVCIKLFPSFSFSYPSQHTKKPTVAVLNFQSNTGDTSIDAMLSTGTSETIVSDLSIVEEIEVVERVRIVEAMKEIKLGLTGLIDEKTAQKAGRLVGAQYILMGHWQRFGSQYRVNARLVEVETGSIIHSIKETGYESSIFDLQDNISEQILSNLQITITDREKVRIRKRETVSIEAYQEFSKGLVEYDRGHVEQMKVHMANALQIDPNYEKPKKYILVQYNEEGEKLFEGGSKQELFAKNIVFSTLVVGIGFVAVNALMPEDERMATGTAMITGIVVGAAVGWIMYSGSDIKKEEK